MISEVEFWDWFKRNNLKYFYLNQIEDEKEREKLLDEFLEKLHEYSENLFFQVGGKPDAVQDLIISAEGNIDYFNKVEDLVKVAPSLKDWNVIAFKPPVVSRFVLEQDGARIDSMKTWFIPLEIKGKPGLLGLRLFVEDYSPEKKQAFLETAYQALDSLLGEKWSALNVYHIEVATLPTAPEDQGLIPLAKLHDYIDFFIRKRLT